MESDVSVKPVMGKSSFRIHWIVQGIVGSERDGFTSELATNRYRAIIPAQQLRATGHLVDFIAADGWQWGSGARPDLIILGKLLPSVSAHEFSRMSNQVLTQAHSAIEDGVPIIADFNDDHFGHPVLGPHWVQAASIATLCVTASQSMAEVVQRFTRSPVVVIPDPIASPMGTPRVFHPTDGIARFLSRWAPGLGSKRLKLVWYGHPSNWPAMERWGPALEALSQKYPLLLWVVTTSTPQVLKWIEEFNVRNAPAAMAEWVEWSEEAQWSHVHDADAVLLPSDPSDPRLGVKSSNRLTDALNAGRYVVGSAMASYQPFGAYCSLTEEPANALEWMVINPRAALRKIAGGQAVVRELVSAEAVAQKWAKASIYASQFTGDHVTDRPSLADGEHLPVTAVALEESTTGYRNPSRSTEPRGQSPGSPPLPQFSGAGPSMLPTLLDLHLGKTGKVSDKWESYFSAYERLFSPSREKAVNLIEIGVQNGGSLEVWAQYFLNATHIIGCDIDPKCANLHYVDPRITVIIGDATASSTRTQLMKICDSFDIVIDDGSHLSTDIVSAFLSYFPLLRPGGLYVVEDTHALYRSVPGGGVLSGSSAQQFFKHCAELTNLVHWEGQLQAKTLMSTFIPHPDDFPVWLTQGSIESVEFRNSMVAIRKAERGTALGRRMIAGVEALVHPAVLRHQASSLRGAIDIGIRQFAPNVSARSEPADHVAAVRFQATTAVRLNLGCGDKILPGYINVDVAVSRSEKQPDLICDLRDLSTLGADYADEVLAVHVVEHFWRWEVEDILRGWVRVLKPGGRMILECPNLTSACEEFLKDPVSRCRPSQDGQRTMWVFYGDPSWKDPLMVHRWAYTPDSLSELLRTVGLVDVKREPAQYKLREPRDMRITGKKPKNP